MNSERIWEVRVKKPARKSVERAPRPERERLGQALDEMAQNPFAGDVERLKNERTAFRHRVGDWRLFFDVYPHILRVDVLDIQRRTTTTYRRRR